MKQSFHLTYCHLKVYKPIVSGKGSSTDLENVDKTILYQGAKFWKYHITMTNVFTKQKQTRYTSSSDFHVKEKFIFEQHKSLNLFTFGL